MNIDCQDLHLIIQQSQHSATRPSAKLYIWQERYKANAATVGHTHSELTCAVLLAHGTETRLPYMLM